MPTPTPSILKKSTKLTGCSLNTVFDYHIVELVKVLLHMVPVLCNVSFRKTELKYVIYNTNHMLSVI